MGRAAWQLLLHGWTIADVTYYTTEIPQYMLIELIRGLGPDVEHIAAASTYTLLLLAAGLLARGRSTGREGLIRFAVAAGIMIAPQFGNATHLLLSQPDHLGTQLPLLLAFLLLDRAPRRWYVPVAVGAILTLVVIADQVAMLTAAVPLAIVCGARALLGVVWNRKSLASQWYELSLVAVAVLSYAAAKLAVRLIIHLHGFQVLPLATKRTPIADIGQHIVLTVDGILNVFAADFLHLSKSSLLGPSLGGLPMAAGIALAAVHLVGVALAVWGFFRAFRYFFDPSDLVSPVLATAIVVNVAAYVLSIVPVTLFDTREIVAVLPFGAVLAGRMVPGTLTRLPRRLKPALAWVSVGVLACYMAGLGYGTAHRPVADFDQAIVPWLEAHHLTTGLGTYFEANLITMDSGGRVAVRTVSWQFTRDVPRRYESKADWYDPRQSYANFIVTNTADNTQQPRREPSPQFPDPPPGHRGPARGSARACLPLQDVHHHGLEPQSPRRPGQNAIDLAWQDPLSRQVHLSGLPVGGDVLRLGKLQQPVVGTLAADAGLLHPAERRGRVGDQAAIQPDHARLERFGDPQPAAQVARVDVGHQAELRRVRPPDRVRLVGEPHHRRYRAEDLGVQDRGLRGHPVEQRRLVEEAAPVRLAAPGHHRGAVGDVAPSTSSATLDLVSSLTSGPSSVSSSRPGPTFNAARRAANVLVNSSATASCT